MSLNRLVGRAVIIAVLVACGACIALAGEPGYEERPTPEVRVEEPNYGSLPRLLEGQTLPPEPLSQDVDSWEVSSPSGPPEGMSAEALREQRQYELQLRRQQHQYELEVRRQEHQEQLAQQRWERQQQRDQQRYQQQQERDQQRYQYQQFRNQSRYNQYGYSGGGYGGYGYQQPYQYQYRPRYRDYGRHDYGLHMGFHCGH